MLPRDGASPFSCLKKPISSTSSFSASSPRSAGTAPNALSSSSSLEAAVLPAGAAGAAPKVGSKAGMVGFRASSLAGVFAAERSPSEAEGGCFWGLVAAWGLGVSRDFEMTMKVPSSWTVERVRGGRGVREQGAGGRALEGPMRREGLMQREGEKRGEGRRG